MTVSPRQAREIGLPGAAIGRIPAGRARVANSIQPDGGGKDVFDHISAVGKAGFTNLVEGAKVSYEEVANRGKTSAENLRLL